MGYSPWGCKRVRYDLATKQQQIFGSNICVFNYDVNYDDNVPGTLVECNSCVILPRKGNSPEL